MREVKIKIEDDAYTMFRDIADGTNVTMEDIFVYFINLGIESFIRRNKEKINSMVLTDELNKYIFKKVTKK